MQVEPWPDIATYRLARDGKTLALVHSQGDCQAKSSKPPDCKPFQFVSHLEHLDRIRICLGDISRHLKGKRALGIQGISRRFFLTIPKFTVNSPSSCPLRSFPLLPLHRPPVPNFVQGPLPSSDLDSQTFSQLFPPLAHRPFSYFLHLISLSSPQFVFSFSTSSQIHQIFPNDSPPSHLSSTNYIPHVVPRGIIIPAPQSAPAF